MNTTTRPVRALLCAASLVFSALGPATAQRIDFDFNDGLQGWAKIYPVTGILWQSGALGAYHDGWDVGVNDFTTFGRSPAFYLVGSGALTFQLAGGQSPVEAPAAPSDIPEFAIEGGGFAGVALRDVATDSYVLSRRRSGNGGEWQNNQFSAAELEPFVNDGRKYTLDYLDYNRGSWGWTYLDNVSIPGSFVEPEAPADLQATAGATSATLTWDAPFAAASYSIRRSTSSGSGFTEVGTSPSTTFTDHNLAPGTTYHYIVVASNESGAGPASAEAAVAPVGGVPSSASSVVSLTFGSAGDAKVSGTAISKFLRVGTNLNLAPSLTLSPFAKADPPSGTLRNFSVPQNYTITAEDGSTSVVTVTVNLVSHLDYDFNDGLQGWEQIYPVFGILWENGRLGAYHDGLDVGINDFTTFGRSPAFYIVDSGPLTFQLDGGQSPLDAPHVGPSEIPEFAILSGGFAGVALREVESNTYVLSRRRTGNGGGWQNNQFSQAELAPFTDNGKQYTLDYIDYNRGGWGWTYLDNVSIPGVIAEPGTEALLTLIQITPNNHVESFGNDIEIIVPYGTDLSSIVPLVSISPEAQISPAIGTALDFNDPVVFTVTSGDGLANEEFTVTARIGGMMTVRTYQDSFGDNMLEPISNLLFRTPTGSGDHFGNILYGDGRFPDFTSSLPGLSRNDEFSIVWEGWFDVTKDGHGFYTFGTNSDDGSMIYFDLDGDGSFDGPGELIVSNNGVKPMTIRTRTVNLQMDSVRVIIGYYEAVGGEGMEARFAKGENLPFGSLAPIGGISGHFLPEEPAANPSSAGLWYVNYGNSVATAVGDDRLHLWVPPGSDLTALDPGFMISPGATAFPPSGTLRDFSTPQTYTVTSAAETTTRTYTVSASVELRYDFNDGSLQGWNNRVWDLAANGGSGGWIDLAPNVTFLPFSVNGGVLQPPSEANGLFVPANGGVWVSGNTDWHANTLWLRSPAFYLSSFADLTVDLSRGTARTSDPTHESEIPHVAIEGAGWKGVALRRVSDGAFLLTKPRLGENGDEFRTVRFTSEELAPFHGTACTLELINYDRGGWGWIVMDNVTIPSLGLVLGSPFETWIAGYPSLVGSAADPGADPDADGKSNLEEFAFGTDPTSGVLSPISYSFGNVDALGQPFLDSSAGFSIVFGRRVDYSALGLVYTVQFSADLDEWVDSAAVPEVVGADFEVEAVRVKYPASIITSGGDRTPLFARVKITLN